MSLRWFSRYWLSLILRPRNRYRLIRRAGFGARVLDVGCGNDSPYYTKGMCPGIKYTGIDIQDYHQARPNLADNYIICYPSEFSREIMGLSGSFDVVISSHNLEHCDDQDGTLAAMLGAIKAGGWLYLVIPCEASTGFPNRHGTLNYFDDHTHKPKPPHFDSLVKVIEESGFEIEFSSRRYRPILLFLLGAFLEPLSALRRKVYLGTWELYGVNSVIWARRSP